MLLWIRAMIFFFRKHRLNPADARAQKEICGAWKQKPLLSLICVAFNTSEEYFKELLSSVLNQTYTHFELIVVDVSTAGSTTVKNVLARYNDDRIRVVKAENKSIAENTNVGIAVAQGDYIAFIDHDDVIDLMRCMVCTRDQATSTGGPVVLR